MSLAASSTRPQISCGGIVPEKPRKAQKQELFHRNLGGAVGSLHVYENGFGPKRSQSR